MGRRKSEARAQVWIVVAVMEGEQEPLAAYTSEARAQRGKDAFSRTNTTGYGVAIEGPIPLDEIPVTKMEPLP